MPLAAHQAAA
jgi:hypothetical protein